MSKKRELKKAIEDAELEIEALESKRIRSQSALLDAFLNKTEPNEMDKEYYRIYSSLIEIERKNIAQLKQELDKLG